VQDGPASTAQEATVDLTGNVALVTGASRGFGKAIAVQLAVLGCDVALAARSAAPGSGAVPGSLQETTELVESFGRRALMVPTDLSDPEQVVAMVETTVRELGAVDFLMNNAGIGTVGDIAETTFEDWNQILAVNLSAQFIAIKTATAHMRARGGGAVVNMSSCLAHEVPDPRDGNPVSAASTAASGPGITPYGVTKAGIRRLTLGAAADLAKDNIRVNCIAPSWTETEGLNMWFPEIDKSAWERPEDWAAVVAYLMSPLAKGITGVTVTSAEQRLLVPLAREVLGPVAPRTLAGAK
jgi:NAD(P)-dependent dehydrogenase (short-subunit alcohol dehydrogenase family)